MHKLVIPMLISLTTKICSQETIISTLTSINFLSTYLKQINTVSPKQRERITKIITVYIKADMIWLLSQENGRKLTVLVKQLGKLCVQYHIAGYWTCPLPHLGFWTVYRKQNKLLQQHQRHPCHPSWENGSVNYLSVLHEEQSYTASFAYEKLKLRQQRCLDNKAICLPKAKAFFSPRHHGKFIDSLIHSACIQLLKVSPSHSRWLPDNILCKIPTQLAVSFTPKQRETMLGWIN